MRRSYIYVVLSGDRWAVKLHGHSVVQLFDRKAQAVRAANDAAQEIWTEAGLPTGVRVQLSNGTWQDERTYGTDPPGAD